MQPARGPTRGRHGYIFFAHISLFVQDSPLERQLPASILDVSRSPLQMPAHDVLSRTKDPSNVSWANPSSRHSIGCAVAV
jgi:hypothetical protein